MSFDEAGETYRVGVNDITNIRHLYCVKKLLNIAESITPITTVLDCPCGSGRFSNLFTQYKLTCGDLSDRRLEAAKKLVHGNDVRFLHCDIFQTPFEDSSFDFVLCAFVLQHFTKDQYPIVFQELSRITKSWLLITYNTDFSPLNFRRSYKTTLTKDEFNKISNGAGFTTIEEIYSFPLFAASKLVLLKKQAV